MTAIAIARASAALLFCMAAVVSGQARAQNYDGAGLLRFGAFTMIAPTEFDIDRPIAAQGSATGTDWGGGVSYGYDLLLHNGWILGVESDISFDTLQVERAGREFSVDYMATVRGRFGSYVRPDLLLYGTAGVAFLGANFEGVRSPLTGLRGSESDTVVGWTVGGGAEFEWHGITFFGEYLFADYDTFSAEGDVEEFFEFDEATEVITQPLRGEADINQHVFRLGVKFVIGHDFRDEYADLPLK